MKATHAQAGYHEGHGENGSHCSICRHYIAEGPHCTKVVDPIEPDDGCAKYFEPRIGNAFIRALQALSRRRQHFLPQRLFAHAASHHKRPGRADVHHIQLRQLLRQRCRLEFLVAAHIDRPHENHQCHVPVLSQSDLRKSALSAPSASTL
jgi:hypothetical protein